VTVDPVIHVWWNFKGTDNKPMIVQDFLFRKCRRCINGGETGA